MVGLINITYFVDSESKWSEISYLNDILFNKYDSFCTVSRSTCKLGGSSRPQSPIVNCLSYAVEHSNSGKKSFDSILATE